MSVTCFLISNTSLIMEALLYSEGFEGSSIVSLWMQDISILFTSPFRYQLRQTLLKI